ncbi:hypothetical protein QAD02_015112, partial [Eretmocerus hayati]
SANTLHTVKMRITTTLLAACLCAALVNSLPLSGQGLRSQSLDRLMVVEAENDSAQRNKRTIGILRQLFPEVSKSVNPEAVENGVINEADSQPAQSQLQEQPQTVVREQRSPAAAESQQNSVKVSFADEVPSASNDGDLLPLDDIEATNDDSRDKRFLNLSGGGGGGSGGGSGNFLFDIIRQAADSAARAAGTVYRVVAGTQSLGLGLSASRDLGPIPLPMMPAAASGGPGSMMPAPGNGTAMMPPLVAGSGSGSSSSGGEAGANGEARAPEPGPQLETVPGPVTRLFVIANRGISNLIQDLILVSRKL